MKPDDIIQQRLDEAKQRDRALTAGACLGFAVGALAILVVMLYHLDRAIGFGTRERLTTRFALSTAMAVAAGGIALIGARRRLPDRRMALLAEHTYPVLGERLLTAVELRNTAWASAPLAITVADDAARAVERLDLRRAVPQRLAYWSLRFGLGAVVLLLAQVLMAPEGTATWLQRILHPNADIPVWSRTQVRVDPGDTVIPRGDPVRLVVRVTGAPASTALIFTRSGDGGWQRRRIGSDRRTQNGGPLELAIHRVDQDLTYYARANDGASNRYRIKVEDRPIVQSVRLKIRYPEYMRRPPLTSQGSTANLVAPVGSSADLTFTASKQLASAVLTDSGGVPRTLAINDNEAHGTLKLKNDDTIRLTLTDPNGFGSLPDPQYAIRTLRDRPPVVRVTAPNADVERSPDGFVSISAEARDDYGVGSMRLVHGKVSGAPRRTALPIRPGAPGEPARTSISLHLGRLALRPGDTLAYRVEAVDRDNVTGPNVGRSAEYRVRIVSSQEMRERLDASRRQALEELLRLARMQRAIEDRLSAPGASPATARESAAAQRRIGSQTAALRATLDSLVASLQENALATDRELAGLRKLANDLSALATVAMPAAVAQMDAAAGGEPRNGNAALRQAAQQASEIRRSLERLANLHAPPQTPVELAREAAKLAQEQLVLADRSQVLTDRVTPSDADRLKMRRLAQHQAELRERTAALADRLDPAAAADASGKVQEAKRAFEREGVPAQQSQAQRDLETGNASGAEASQIAGARGLERLASNLITGNSSAATPQSLTRQADALDELADRLTDLSNKQRAVQQATERNLSTEEASRVAGDERALESATRSAADRLSAAPGAQDAANRAAQSMGRSAASLAANNPVEARGPARQAVRDLLQAAMEARVASHLAESQAAALEMQRAVEALARDQHALRRKTATERAAAAGKDDAAVAQRSHGLAREQDQLKLRVAKIIDDLPADAMKWMGVQASHRMQESAGRLWGKDMAVDTQRHQAHAASILDRLGRALEHQRLAAALQQEAGSHGSPEHQLADSAGEMRALREMQAQLRSETASIDSRRSARTTPSLTEAEAGETRRLAEAETYIRERLRQVAQVSRESVAEAESIRSIGESVRPIETALQRQETGRPTQQRQDTVVTSLDTLLARNRDELAASVRSRAAAALARAAGKRPARSGTQSAQASPGPGNPPLVTARPGALRPVNPTLHRFGGLGLREQQLLLQGSLDRVPPEYRDLVSRYFRALAESR